MATVAVNDCELLTGKVVAVGVMLTEMTAVVIATVAVACLVRSVTEVAITLTLAGVGATAGAV